MRSGRPRLQTILRPPMRIVALDVGSSSVRAIAYDEDGDGRARRRAPAVRHARCRRARRRVPRGARAGRRGRRARALVLLALAAAARRARAAALAGAAPGATPTGEPPALDPEAYHRRTGCFLHPSFWPAKLAGLDAARYVSFADYLLLRLTGELVTSVSMASGTGRLRSEPARVGRRDARRCRRRRVAAPAGLGRAGRGRLARARRRRVLERRRGLRRARPRRGDDRDVGGCARRLRGAVGRAEARPLPLPARRAPLLRGRRALGRREPPRVARAHAARRPSRPTSPTTVSRFLPFLGGERSLGWDPHRRGLDRRASRSPPPRARSSRRRSKASRTGWPTCSTRSAGSSRSSRPGTRCSSNDAWLQILADVLGRPVEVSGEPEGSARGAAVVALERAGGRPCRRHRSRGSSSRGRNVSRSIWRRGKNNGD